MAKRTISGYNLQGYNPCYTQGYYDIPVLAGCQHIPRRIMPFNFALSTKKTDTGIHFFIDDYQFERVWSNPHRYIELLSKFDCVFTPDFSIYTDMPRAMMIWNTYRSRLMGQMMQEAGLKVIPTVSWAKSDSFDFCFDRLPTRSTLAISTIGTGYNHETKRIFDEGLSEMASRLSPETIIVYGRCTYKFPENINVVRFDNERIQFLRSIGVKKQ